MNLLIAGGRDMINYDILCDGISKFKDTFENVIITGIVTGKARGADSLGERYGVVNDIPIHEFSVDWDKLGKRAGYVRNMEMAKFLVETQGKALIFWDGVSRGTKNMIDILEAMNVDYVIRRYTKEELDIPSTITQKSLSAFCKGDEKQHHYGIDGGMGRDFDGDKLVVTIYDKALSEEEVIQTYKSNALSGYFRNANPEVGGEWCHLISDKNGLQIPFTSVPNMLKSADSRLSKVHNDIFFEDITCKKNEGVI